MNRKAVLKKIGIILPAILILFGSAAPANAQKKEKEKPNERSVVGVVLDKADNALEGAVVQLKNMKTLQIRSYITRTDGRYHFHSISTETDYELRASHQDASSNTRTLSTFDSRKQASMNLRIDK